MKVVSLLVIALAASAGCSDPFTVVVRGEPVSLLAYRDGDGAWQGVTAGDPLRARIEITEGRYSLAWVCASSSTTHVIHSTLADEPFVSCGGGGGGGFATADLFGMTMPNARVYAGSQVTVADSAGFYGTIVAAGYHDVIAVTDEQPARIYIEHDVDLWSSREIALPVAERGVALERRTPVVRGTQQSITIGSQLRTRHGDLVTFPSQGVDVFVPPASVLAAGDVALVRVEGEARDGAVCAAQARAGDGTPTVELPDPPSPVLVHGQLSWSSDVDWDVIDLASGNDASVAYDLRATGDWIAEAGTDAVELPDATQLPGWTPGWQFFRAGDHLRYSLRFEHGAYDGARSTCNVGGDGSW